MTKSLFEQLLALDIRCSLLEEQITYMENIMKFVIRPYNIKYSYGVSTPHKDELTREEFLEECELQLDLLDFRIRSGKGCQADMDRLDQLIAVIEHLKK